MRYTNRHLLHVTFRYFTLVYFTLHHIEHQQQSWLESSTTDLALLASTASAAEHKEFPGRLCRRGGHGRHDAVARCRRGISLVISVDVPRVGRGGTRQIVARRDGVQAGGAGRLVQFTLDVRQAGRRQLPHVGLRVLKTSRDCQQQTRQNELVSDILRYDAVKDV